MTNNSFSFMTNLDSDIQKALLEQIRDLWTHTSTALEGNSLSLGDTKFVLEEGLTVSGKSIRDHQEVIGHAKAIELIYAMLNRNITEADMFELHKAVQTEQINDIYKPYGAWKNEPNFTYIIDDNGKQDYFSYASPDDVPKLMKKMIDYTNTLSNKEIDLEQAAVVYANIHIGISQIHPFWDGNGRIARLIANLPLLNSGLPPIIILNKDRKKYIETLVRYEKKVGTINSKTGIWPKPDALNEFTQFCKTSYQPTMDLVAMAKNQQRLRKNKN